MRRITSRPTRTLKLTLERLERRDVLSAALHPMDSFPPTADENPQVSQDQEVAGNARQWIIGIDGLSGSKTDRVTAAQQRIGSRSSGPAATVRRHLGGNAFLLETGGSLALEDLRNSFANVSGVLYVEPDYVYRTAAVPDDTYFNYLDGMDNTGQNYGAFDADIDAPEAWNYTTGSRSVVVGVIDTGVDYTHTDLAENMWINPYEVPANGYDDDGNGYVDDVHGYDFANDDGDPFDDNGHGTHVAGTIGAVGNNAYGVAGVNWHVGIMALKFLGDSGAGYTSAAVEATYYATMMRQWGVNIRVTNNSWGGGGYSQALRDAIAVSADADMLFVAAAGNQGVNNDGKPHYPSGYNLGNIISVAATDNKNNLAGFSNYGIKSVDLAAPGVKIYSTMPYDEYDFMSGTSMATPHVTGVAALGWSFAPDTDAGEMRNAILGSVDPLSSLASYTTTAGRLNAVRTLQTLSVKPTYDGTGFVLGGAPGRVQIRGLSNGSVIAEFAPFGNLYSGGITVAMADVNKDGYRDIAVGAASGNPHVKIYSGYLIANGFNAASPDSALLTQLFPFALQYNVGANVALGDINGDGTADLITGATAGNPHIKIYNGLNLSNGWGPNALMKEFFAFGLQFNVGANVTSADFNQDGYAELVAGASAGNPHVKVYDGRTLTMGSGQAPLSQFFAFGLQYNVGANVATGDTNGDGVSDLIVGATIGSSHVKVFDGRAIAGGAIPMTNNDWALRTQFFAFANVPNLGVRVGTVDFDYDGRADILTGTSKTWPVFRIVHGAAGGVQPPSMFEEFSTTFSAGVFVGG